MTPLPTNPSVVILVDPGGVPIATATNVSPDLEVLIVNDRAEYEREAAGKPFDTTRIEPEPQVLSSAASAADQAASNLLKTATRPFVGPKPRPPFKG